MARGVNKVTLLGNLGADPVVAHSDSNSSRTKIRIATSRNQKNKQTGQYEEVTEWHNVTFFAKLAEVASEYLKKGDKVYIEGYLKTNKWDDKGIERSTINIIATELQMISNNKEKSLSYDSPENSSVTNKFAHQQDDEIPY